MKKISEFILEDHKRISSDKRHCQITLKYLLCIIEVVSTQEKSKIKKISDEIEQQYHDISLEIMLDSLDKKLKKT